MRHVWIIAVLFLAAPSHAAQKKMFQETAESYYGRLMKSCEYNVRENWRDYLLYAPNKHTDECCAESVKQMAKLGAKLAPSNRQCPENYQINALKCTSSKQWCEAAR
jgi:hypothetical protein